MTVDARAEAADTPEISLEFAPGRARSEEVSHFCAVGAGMPGHKSKCDAVAAAVESALQDATRVARADAVCGAARRDGKVHIQEQHQDIRQE